MQKFANKKIYLPLSIIALVVSLSAWGYHWNHENEREIAREFQGQVLDQLKEGIHQSFSANSNFPKSFAVGQQNIEIDYTINKNLDKFVHKILRRFKSDYSSVVVIDNNNGNILAAVGYNGREKKFLKSLPFSSTHPSASLAKIVTTAALVQNSIVDLNTSFNYRGKATTLYKYQLKSKTNRWTRYQSLLDAFAKSNNVIFGKAAIKYLTGIGLYKMAYKLGFNKNLMNEINLTPSHFGMPKDQYNLAEIASGFNRDTSMSPVHAAILASTVANNGFLKQPKLVTRLVEGKTQKTLWSASPDQEQVLDRQTAKALQLMMRETVSRGTARGSFRRLPRRIRESLIIGGKTGSITGGVPYGKRDWFSMYAMPKDQRFGKGISISIMNVNVKKWYVKAARVGREIMEYYFKKEMPLRRKDYMKVSVVNPQSE
ncbi:MAG: hypothetical protein HN509_00230 [Halobacteriovoraceae bacterium]|jgi:penicillin-binding protein A|nr:hypothetical protein [Halobacteriovoraceae bacterium]MBT5095531.1 hypothetical protein [Halobacteriovoraceae bacterium]